MERIGCVWVVQIIDWVCIESNTKLIIYWVWVELGRVRSG
jgi:hypothetical protein